MFHYLPKSYASMLLK